MHFRHISTDLDFNKVLGQANTLFRPNDKRVVPTSKYQAIGVVLSQVQDGNEKVIMYGSKASSSSQGCE